MDIYMLIHSDHESAKRGMEQVKSLEDSSHAARLERFRALKEELTAHSEAKEATFYIALEEHADTREDADIAFHERHKALRQLEQLDDENLSPVEWRERFAEFENVFNRHIAREENTVFAEARAILSPELACELAGLMQSLKQQRLGEGGALGGMAMTKETIAKEALLPKAACT